MIRLLVPAILLANLSMQVHAEASELIFSRLDHVIVVKTAGGSVSYEAFNNTVRGAAPFPNGTYAFDYHKTHPDDGPNSAYGSLGIIVFKVPGRTGLGVHSGRAANVKNNPGPRHPTEGCIRTNDAGMTSIMLTHKKDPIKQITVKDRL